MIEDSKPRILTKIDAQAKKYEKSVGDFIIK
jgi:hypothetical protein